MVRIYTQLQHRVLEKLCFKGLKGKHYKILNYNSIPRNKYFLCPLTIYVASLDQGGQAGIAGTDNVEKARLDSVDSLNTGVEHFVLLLERHDDFEDTR